MNKMPVFIKISEYKQIVEVMDIIKAKIIKAKNLIDNVNELKRKEDSLVDKWRQDLVEVEQRIEEIDRAMFEPETE